MTTQVLVEWLGLDPDEKTWEDIETIARLVSSSNLEDKVESDGKGDVTIGLDLAEVVLRLKEDLPIEEQGQEEPTTEKQPERLTQNSGYVYY